METFFVCPECRDDHAEPASADLGHLGLCIHCALRVEVEAEQFVRLIMPEQRWGPLAA